MKILEAVNTRAYDIVLSDSFKHLKECIDKVCAPSSICIITDSHIAPLYLDDVRQIAEQIAPTCTHVFEAGEASKNISIISPIYDTLLANKLDRSSLIIALGGGVVGDIAGFAAATYMRGIPFVQVPTTIVAQNDSSIGGKVGIDYQEYKNIVGAFHNPVLVYININTLKTLPEREMIGGLSEVIKHALIYDAGLFEFLAREKDNIFQVNHPITEEMTYRSCKVKCTIVEEDPKEHGIRKVLNFGHTVGHAIETLSHFKYSHGECVAYGICVASFISYKRNLLSKEQVNRIIKLCHQFGLLKPIDFYSDEAIWDQMLYDKKKAHGKISFILLKNIGETTIATDIDQGEIEAAMGFLRETCN